MKIIILLAAATLNIAFPQNEPVEVSSKLSASIDIASRYVWRGTDFGNSPSIQPGIIYTSGALSLGASNFLMAPIISVVTSLCSSSE